MEAEIGYEVGARPILSAIFDRGVFDCLNFANVALSS